MDGWYNFVLLFLNLFQSQGLMDTQDRHPYNVGSRFLNLFFFSVPGNPPKTQKYVFGVLRDSPRFSLVFSTNFRNKIEISIKTAKLRPIHILGAA